MPNKLSGGQLKNDAWRLKCVVSIDCTCWRPTTCGSYRETSGPSATKTARNRSLAPADEAVPKSLLAICRKKYAALQQLPLAMFQLQPEQRISQQSRSHTAQSTVVLHRWVSHKGPERGTLSYLTFCMICGTLEDNLITRHMCPITRMMYFLLDQDTRFALSHTTLVFLLVVSKDRRNTLTHARPVWFRHTPSRSFMQASSSPPLRSSAS